eukprot:161994-Amphidinium_carterae.3
MGVSDPAVYAGVSWKQDPNQFEPRRALKLCLLGIVALKRVRPTGSSLRVGDLVADTGPRPHYGLEG